MSNSGAELLCPLIRYLPSLSLPSARPSVPSQPIVSRSYRLHCTSLWCIAVEESVLQCLCRAKGLQYIQWPVFSSMPSSWTQLEVELSSGQSSAVAGGRSFFTSISSVSIVELPSGGWTLFYDQDIARCPHLLVIITMTDIVINISIDAILCTVTVTYPYQDNHPIQSIHYRPFKTCYRNIQFFFSPVCRLVPWQPACYSVGCSLYLSGLSPGESIGGTHQWND